MVSRCCCMLLTLLPAAWLHAAPLTFSLDSTQVEYGKPVWLTIETAQRDVSLAQLDFARWAHELVVFDEQEVATDAASGVQRRRVRLYPRRQGRIELPPLLLAGVSSPTLILESVQPVDSKTGTPIGIDCQVSDTTPYRQQQVLAACDVLMQDAHVLFDYPRHTVAAARLLPMQVTRARQGVNTQHQAGWVLIPQRSGVFEADLPPLQLVRDGVITHRFYLPRLQLDVRPLPLYLPGTIPVAQVQVTRYAPAQALLSPDKLSHVELQLEVAGAPAEALPDYAQRVPSKAWLRTYAAELQREQSVTAQGIRQVLRYTIPVTPQRQGLYRLPALRLQYFDPHSGILQSVQIPGQRVLVLGLWARAIILLLVIALLVPLVRRVYRVLTRAVWRWRRYRAALAQLETTPTLATIRQAMQCMAQAEGWSANLTYRQWYAKMQCACSAAFPYQALDEMSYAGETRDLQPVRAWLRQLCRRRRYRLFTART